jgi:hypothetical protein
MRSPEVFETRGYKTGSSWHIYNKSNTYCNDIPLDINPMFWSQTMI